MNHFFCSLQSLFFSFKTAVGNYQLRQWVALGALAIALWVGSLGLYLPSAHAASALETEASDAGPIRQTRNPISNENLNGGVDLTALDRKGKTMQQPPEPDTGIVDTLKNLVPGLSSDGASAASPRSDIQPEKNPTLDRYTNQD